MGEEENGDRMRGKSNAVKRKDFKKGHRKWRKKARGGIRKTKRKKIGRKRRETLPNRRKEEYEWEEAEGKRS